MLPAHRTITEACAKWAPKNLPDKSINRELPDHHEYLEPIIDLLRSKDVDGEADARILPI